MSHRKRKDEKCEPSLSSKKMNKRVLSLSSEENSHVSSPVGLALFPFCPRRSGILEESYSFEVKEKERITAVHGEKKKNKTLTGTLVKQNGGEKLGWFYISYSIVKLFFRLLTITCFQLGYMEQIGAKERSLKLGASILLALVIRLQV